MSTRPESLADAPSRRVVAVVLNWNGREVLPAALASLRRQDYPELEVVLVDNASTDGSLAKARQDDAELMVVANESNLGFAAGSNTGIRAALKSKADYVLLVNNDVVLDPTAVSLLMRAAESDPRIGIVAPSLRRSDAPQLLDAAYGVVRFNHVIVQRLGVSEDAATRFNTARDVDCVFGAVLLVRSTVFEAVGLLDEDFWMFLEEVEFCYRAHQAGFRIRYLPEAIALHGSGHSIRTAGVERMKTYLLRRNSVLFMRRHGAPVRWCWFAMCAGLSLAASLAGGILRGRLEGFSARFDGYRDGWAGRPVDPEQLIRRFAR